MSARYSSGSPSSFSEWSMSYVVSVLSVQCWMKERERVHHTLWDDE